MSSDIVKDANLPQGSFCVEKSDKDRIMVFNKKDLKGPLKQETLKILEKHDDEPGICIASDISVKCLFN
jgi:hypothetical protein